MYWKALLAALSFFTNLFLVRLFGASVSAEYYSFVYLLSLLATLFSFGLDISLNYFLSRREIPAATAWRIIAGAVIFSLACSLPLLALTFHLFAHPHISLGNWLLFSALHISGTLLTNLSATIFTAYGRSWRATGYTFAVNVLLIIFLFIISFFFQGTARLVEHLFLLLFSFSFLQGCLLFVMAVITYGDRREDTAGQHARIYFILRYSIRAFIINFIFFLGARLSIYLLPYFADANNLGNYIQAYKLVEYIGLAASFLYYPFMAWVAGAGEEKNKARALLLLIRIAHTGMLFFCIGVLLFGKMVFPWMYGHSFERMYGITLFFMPGLFPVFSSTFFTAYFYGVHRLKNNFISGGIQLVLSVILFFPLKASLGVWGAALSFSIASLGSMAYDCIIFRKITAYRPADVLFMRTGDWKHIKVFVLQLLKLEWKG
jgi:O-antigen/teichoic acid export membrane protein